MGKVRVIFMDEPIVWDEDGKMHLTERQAEAYPGLVARILDVFKVLAEQERNAVYNGMTDQERMEAVHAKWERGELDLSDMTRLETRSWEAKRGQLRTAFDQRLARMDNHLWNIENHLFLVKRVNSLRDKLSADEWQAVEKLMESCHWGPAEIERVKEIIETAAWFSKLLGMDEP